MLKYNNFKKSMVTVAGLHCLYKAAQLHTNTSKCKWLQRHPPWTQISLLVCLSVFLFNSAVQHVLEKPSRREREIQRVFRHRKRKSVAAKTEEDRILSSKFAALHSALDWKMSCNRRPCLDGALDMSVEDLKRKWLWCSWLTMIAANVNWLLRNKDGFERIWLWSFTSV